MKTYQLSGPDCWSRSGSTECGMVSTRPSYQPKVTCKACLRLVARWMRNDEST